MTRALMIRLTPCERGHRVRNRYKQSACWSAWRLSVLPGQILHVSVDGPGQLHDNIAEREHSEIRGE